MQSNNKHIFGVVGGSGAGKSYVTGLFAPYNAYIIEADKVGHEVLQTTAYDKVISAFGESILAENKSIDRKKLGAIVFANKKELKKLDAVMMPLITEYIYKEIADKIRYHDIIVLDAALLFELKLDLVCDHILLVAASDKARIERIKLRDNISEEHAINRIKSQRDFSKLEKKEAITVIKNG